MFYSKDLATSLNSLYKADDTDDMLTHEAMKTPNGVTEKIKQENNVIAPLLSISNGEGSGEKHKLSVA